MDSKLYRMAGFHVVLSMVFVLGGYGCDDAQVEEGPQPQYITMPNSGADCTTDADCDDESPCTEDSCGGSDGCRYLAVVTTCEDDDPCTVGEICTDGVCGGGTDACGCRVDDDCAALDDGNRCNGVLRCNTDQAPYACEFDPTSIVTCEGEAAACQELACDPATGMCGEVNAPNDTVCDDGDACSSGDTCLDGQCVGGPPSGCDGLECGESADGCSCGTCADDALCTNAGTCLATGDACGNVPPRGLCQDGALLSCQAGALVVEPCAGCCVWDAQLKVPACAEGEACEDCVDECEADTTGCDERGTHAWTCEDLNGDDCLERAYTVCQNGLCAPDLGACVDNTLDADDDGVPDLLDNCPDVANAEQLDTDEDTEGDACDGDDDGDGVVDEIDNCPTVVTEDVTDTDDDGTGDVCDTDDDDDGVLDEADNCPLSANADQYDGDGDGDGDACNDPAPCHFDNLPNRAATELPNTLRLGDFDVAISNEAIIVRHRDEPLRNLFEPPVDGSWLKLARAHLEAEEHQGSFALHEELFTRCSTPVINSAHHQLGSLLVTGGFADEGPECAQADWTVRICEAGPHRLSMKVAADDPNFDLVVLRTASDPDEYIWGAGEQFPHGTLNLNSRNLPIMAQEGGLGRGHTPITEAVNVASEGSGGSEDTTYYAAAHYLTSRARSMFLENTETAFFDFSADDAIEMRLYGTEMAAQVVHGTEPLELIERFTDWTGRMVAPPAWANEGAIVALARPLDESLEHVDNLLEAGAALGGVWNQTWSGTAVTFIGEQVLWNWVLNENAHPNWHDWVDALDERGIRVLCYVNTMFRELPEDVGPVSRDLFAEGLAADHFVHNEDGEVLMIPVTAFDVALLDLANEDARIWMKSIIQDEMLDNARCSGWMADFAEALPFEAVMADGLEGDVWHNRYPVEWAALNREALNEVGRLDDTLVFNRSGHTKTPGAALAMWQGDQLVTWDRYDGLVSAIHGLISGGFSGIAINHSDIGGYTSMTVRGIGYGRSEELLKRWTEMAAFTALMRTHEGNQPQANAQVYSNEGTRSHFARMTRIYRALAFYRAGLFEEAATRGWPVVRHPVMHWPNEEALYDVADQFLLGTEILVAPIKNKCFNPLGCAYNKDVTLPPGRWIHLWSGEASGEAESVSEVTVQAPLGEPAVFYREGSDVGATFVQNLQAEGIEVQAP